MARKTSTPQSAVCRCAGPWIHRAPSDNVGTSQRDVTDPSSRYRGRLGGNLLGSEAQLSRGLCQSCRDRDRDRDGDSSRPGVPSSVREVAVFPTGAAGKTEASA